MVKFDPEAIKDLRRKKDEWTAEKSQRWELRTIKQALGYAGWSSQQIRHLEEELGENLSWASVNEQGQLHDAYGAKRELKYNFEAFMLDKPHPVVEDWFDLKDAYPLGNAALIFRCAEFAGTIDPRTFVVSNRRLDEAPFSYITIPVDGQKLYVYPFKEYVQQVEGTVADG